MKTNLTSALRWARAHKAVVLAVASALVTAVAQVQPEAAAPLRSALDALGVALGG